MTGQEEVTIATVASGCLGVLAGFLLQQGLRQTTGEALRLTAPTAERGLALEPGYGEGVSSWLRTVGSPGLFSLVQKLCAEVHGESS